MILKAIILYRAQISFTKSPKSIHIRIIVFGSCWWTMRDVLQTMFAIPFILFLRYRQLYSWR